MSKTKGAIQIELYDHSHNQRICTADILFGLENLIVLSCEGMEKQELHEMLMDRSTLPRTYEIDDIVLKALNLSDRAYEFGRMSEACVLYAMLNHFAKEEDALRVYPLKTEFVSMIDLDFRYSNIYIWKSREECNNDINA